MVRRAALATAKWRGVTDRKNGGRCVCACVFGGDCVNVRVCVWGASTSHLVSVSHCVTPSY